MVDATRPTFAQRYPLVYRIVATLRAPQEATEVDIRTVLRVAMPSLNIESITLIPISEPEPPAHQPTEGSPNPDWQKP